MAAMCSRRRETVLWPSTARTRTVPVYIHTTVFAFALAGLPAPSHCEAESCPCDGCMGMDTIRQAAGHALERGRVFATAVRVASPALSLRSAAVARGIGDHSGACLGAVERELGAMCEDHFFGPLQLSPRSSFTRCYAALGSE